MLGEGFPTMKPVPVGLGGAWPFFGTFVFQLSIVRVDVMRKLVVFVKGPDSMLCTPAGGGSDVVTLVIVVVVVLTVTTASVVTEMVWCTVAGLVEVDTVVEGGATVVVVVVETCFSLDMLTVWVTVVVSLSLSHGAVDEAVVVVVDVDVEVAAIDDVDGETTMVDVSVTCATWVVVDGVLVMVTVVSPGVFSATIAVVVVVVAVLDVTGGEARVAVTVEMTVEMTVVASLHEHSVEAPRPPKPPDVEVAVMKTVLIGVWVTVVVIWEALVMVIVIIVVSVWEELVWDEGPTTLSVLLATTTSVAVTVRLLVMEVVWLRRHTSQR
jgi:hypothetical protein